MSATTTFHALRLVLVLAATGFGTLTAVGCYLAIIFEIDGFARPGDGGVRAWYVGVLGLALAGSVAVPVTLVWWLFPAVRRGWVLAGAGALAALMILSLGLR